MSILTSQLSWNLFLFRTDFGPGMYLLLLSIHSVLLLVEGSFRDRTMWIVPDRRASIAHLQGTRIPALDSRAH